MSKIHLSLTLTTVVLLAATLIFMNKEEWYFSTLVLVGMFAIAWIKVLLYQYFDGP